MSLSVLEGFHPPCSLVPPGTALSIQAKDDQSARREVRSARSREKFYAVYRNFSCLANRRIASSMTAVWLMPRWAASLTNNARASWLIRMLVKVFFMNVVYHTMRYMSNGSRQGLKPKSPHPVSEERGFRRAKAHMVKPLTVLQVFSFRYKVPYSTLHISLSRCTSCTRQRSNSSSSKISACSARRARIRCSFTFDECTLV